MGEDARGEVRADAYRPPKLTVLGTVAELTQGNNTAAHTDGTFPGSLFV